MKFHRLIGADIPAGKGQERVKSAGIPAVDRWHNSVRKHPKSDTKVTQLDGALAPQNGQKRPKSGEVSPVDGCGYSRRKTHTVLEHSMDQERTFIHHKTGHPTTMRTGNIGKSPESQQSV